LVSKVVLVATNIYCILWQTTHHGEGMACHENIILTRFIIMRSTIFIIIKPWRCNERSILPLMEDVDNQFTLCRGPFQSILIGWSLLQWWCTYEKNVRSCVTKNTNNLTTYTQALKYFVDFIESWKPFSNTPPMNDLNLFPYELWDLIGANVHTHWHPLFVEFWHKCVWHHHVSRVGIHVHLSIAKCKIDWQWNMMKTWCTFTLITSFSKNDLVPTPLHGMKKICCLNTKYVQCWFQFIWRQLIRC
jgi:hypothetical protein